MKVPTARGFEVDCQIENYMWTFYVGKDAYGRVCRISGIVNTESHAIRCIRAAIKLLGGKPR